MKKPTRWISLLTALLLGATAQAEMITVGGDQTNGTGTLTVNYDLVFTITETVTTTTFFIFDEIVISDGGQSQMPFSGLEFSINGGSRITLNTWTDNVSGTVGDVTPNDGFIFGDSSSFVSGDTVTLHAGTGTMAFTDPTFNPWSSGDYDVFMADNNTAERISDVVPEPATALLFGIGGLGAFIVRRNKKNQEEA